MLAMELLVLKLHKAYVRGLTTYHVKGDDILEGDFTSLVLFDEDSVDADRGGTSRETKNERMFRGWFESLDPI